MPRPIAQIICLIAICFVLVGCNEEKEKKVFAQTDEAMKFVQTQKIAADLESTAQLLLASPATVPLTDLDIHTARCSNEKVIAYIPETSKLTENKTLPLFIAQRIKTDLSRRFKPENIVTPTTIDPACGTLTDVAINSPILQLNGNFASEGVVVQDQSNIVSVAMDSCGIDANGKRIPGIVITKHLKDGTIIGPDSSNCGQSAPASVDVLTLTNTTLPDWKGRLLGTPGAVTNILCIQGSGNCTPVAEGDIGTQVTCDNPSRKAELMVNPVFDKTQAKFKPGPNAISCGKGWNGKMVAQVQTKECKLKRSDGTQQTPATVINVAYIGAKCEKTDVLLSDACPAGTPFANTGSLMSSKHIVMKQPIALLPVLTGSNPTNSIVYNYTDPLTNQVKTNIDPNTPWGAVVQGLQTGPQTVLQVPSANDPATTTSMNFFSSTANLNGYNDVYDFDSAFVKTLKARSMLNNPQVTACYAAAQNCSGGDPVKMVTVVVDRSGSMAGGGRAITPTQTFCRATMANLFRPEKRTDACIAARAWQNIADSTYQIHSKAIAEWEAGHEPVSQGTQLYDAIIKDANRYIDQGFADNEIVMTEALADRKNIGVLKSALMRGQDCYPAAVQDNMFGSCAQTYVSPNDLKASNFSVTPDNNKTPPAGPLLSCQSACPGVCITDAIARVQDLNNNGVIDGSEADRNADGLFKHGFVPSPTQQNPTSAYLPVDMPSANRMEVVDNFTRSNLLTNLPVGVKLYYSEFIDSQTDSSNHSDVSRKPIELTLDDDNDPNNNTQNMDMTFWWKKIFDSMDEKFKPRGNHTVGGGTPLYASTDPAIDKMLDTFLKADPNTPAVLVVLSDGADNGPDSKYFGRNFCEADAPLPSGYRCKNVRSYSCGFLGWGTCHETTYMDVDRDAVKQQYGIEYSGTRQQWCASKGYANGSEEKGKLAVTGQENSLVGIIGRNFPKTKIFYLGIDAGSTLANNCNGKKFYTDVNRMKHQVLYPFAYSDSASEQISEAFQEATGGGLPDIEVGKKVCKTSFGDGVNISLDAPAHKPPDIISFSNQALPPTCTIAYMNVLAPPGTVVLPPNYIPDPIFPPPGSSNPYDLTGQDCVPYGSRDGNGMYHGYTNDNLMQPCTVR